jgi:hypothetical protein
MRACAYNLSFTTFCYFNVDVDGVVRDADIACQHQLSLRSPVKAAIRCSLDLSLLICIQESEKASAPKLRSLLCPISKPARLVTVALFCFYFREQRSPF